MTFIFLRLLSSLPAGVWELPGGPAELVNVHSRAEQLESHKIVLSKSVLTFLTLKSG